jgi:hypothetical protein
MLMVQDFLNVVGGLPGMADGAGRKPFKEQHNLSAKDSGYLT